MGILDQIKECSILFGQADDPFNFSSDKMAMLLPDVALDSDEKRAMISLLCPGSDGGSCVNSDELRSKSESDEASRIHKDYSDSEQGNIMKYQDYIESVNPQKVFKIDYIKKTDGKHEIYQDVILTLIKYLRSAMTKQCRNYLMRLTEMSSMWPH